MTLRDQIDQLTDDNDHNGAVMALAIAAGDTAAIATLREIIADHEERGWIELQEQYTRDKIEKRLRAELTTAGKL